MKKEKSKSTKFKIIKKRIIKKKENSKKIWFRVGMEACLSDNEYTELIKAYKTGDNATTRKLFENIIKNGSLSGETYIVGQNDGGVSEYDNPDEEISYIF